MEIPATGIFEPGNTHDVEISGLGRLEAFPNGDALHYADLLGLDVNDHITNTIAALQPIAAELGLSPAE